MTTNNLVSVNGYPYHVKPTGAEGVWEVSPHQLQSVAVYRYRNGVWSCSRCQPTSKDECTHIQAVQAWEKKEARV